MMPNDPTVGGTVLRRPAIQSPDFVHGVSGWAINADGSAEFHVVELPSGSGGATVYFDSSEPSNPNTGDLWYDTADGLLLSQWDGSAWVPHQIGTGAIADGAVTTALIGDQAVDTAKLADGAVDAVKIADGAVGNAQIGDLIITANKFNTQTHTLF